MISCCDLPKNEVKKPHKERRRVGWRDPLLVVISTVRK